MQGERPALRHSRGDRYILDARGYVDSDATMSETRIRELGSESC
jgi:hypothetical protein